MDDVSDRAVDILTEYVGSIFAKCIVKLSSRRSGCSFDAIDRQGYERLLTELEAGMRNYITDDHRRGECREKLVALLRVRVGAKGATAVPRATVVDIAEEADIVRARSAGKSLAASMGFPVAVQIRVATAISELARNIVQYVGKGVIEIRAITTPQAGIEVVAVDDGPGIGNLDTILDGGYQSKSGMGLGLLGAKRLMDHFDVATGPGRGTRVTLRKFADH